MRRARRALAPRRACVIGPARESGSRRAGARRAPLGLDLWYGGSMLHAFRLGPFPVGDDAAYAYGAIDERGALVAPAIASSDEEGLRELASRGHPGPLRCEPALATAGKAQGFESAKLPRAVLVPRAVLAFGLGRGATRSPPPPPLLVRFFEACAAFWSARPWELAGSDDPLAVALEEDGRRVAREGSILGGGGEEFGLALYDEPGSIARVLAAMDRGARAAPPSVAGAVVMLDPEPAWAASAFEDAFGLPRVPIVLRTRGKQAEPATARDLHALAATLEAVTALAEDDDLRPARAAVEVLGAVVTAHVALPEEDDELAEPMLSPEPVAPARRSERVPRNAPCPCGSGRKYKKCHLGEDEARERAARGGGPAAEEARAEARRLAERDPIHALDERITADALALARKRWGRAFDPDGALAALGIGAHGAQALLGWSAAHYRGPEGRTALELYLEERGAALDDAGRRYAAALRDAWFSCHEVLAAEPGVSLTLRDMLAGGERVVRERSASRMLRAREVILARVVDLGDRAILAGCHARSLPPREGDLACRFARKALRTRAKAIPPDRLRALTAEGALVAGWEELVRALDRRPPPQLRNTDGEDLLLTVDRFEVAPEKADEIARALRALPGAEAEGDGEDGGPVEIAFIREGNARGALPTTLVGRALLESSTLRLETNSVARANALRILVEDRLGPLVRFKIREHADPVAGLADGPASAPPPEEPMPPEALELVRRLMQEHYRRWLDEPIPALGGLTPRAASRKKGAPLEKLRLLLAEIEHHEALRPAEQRFDVQALRRELGLDG
jgi:hypothetical protein